MLIKTILHRDYIEKRYAICPDCNSEDIHPDYDEDAPIGATVCRDCKSRFLR